MPPAIRLSKSRYMAGLQCPKMLWWRVHEPDAPELQTGPEQQAVFDAGNHVGEVAREHVPGGVLVDFQHYQVSEKIAATAEALAQGAKVVYEASFMADDIFVSVDILERKRGGFVLSEVKGTLDVKEQHIPDVAVQLHVVRQSGLTVKRAEVMHLNRECRHPDLSNLFVRENVTAQAEAEARAVPKQASSLLKTLRGSMPSVEPGAHCTDPYECPFTGRCWPTLPKHHVSTLYRISRKKTTQLVEAGRHTLADLPSDFAATGAALRQIESVRKRRLVVAPNLADALSELTAPLAFLDFETVSLPIPAWPGCSPYAQIPVQFSCHMMTPRGLAHSAWIAEGPADPREALAAALLDACSGAETVLAYNAPFEKRCIMGLKEAVPRFAKKLTQLHDRIADLLPIVRDHVYHPDFNGSFSIKQVLPALVHNLSYDDLEIHDGSAASAALASLLFQADLSVTARRKLKRDLLAYCERDTLAMVRLYERLGELGG